MKPSERSSTARRLRVLAACALFGLTVVGAGAEPDSVTGSMTAGGKTSADRR